MIKANEAKRRPPGTDPVVVVDLPWVRMGGDPGGGARRGASERRRRSASRTRRASKRRLRRGQWNGFPGGSGLEKGQLASDSHGAKTVKPPFVNLS